MIAKNLRKYDFMESPDFEGYTSEEMPISPENELHHYLNAVIHSWITEEGRRYFSTDRGRGNKSRREDLHAKNCSGCVQYAQELNKLKVKGV